MIKSLFSHALAVVLLMTFSAIVMSAELSLEEFDRVVNELEMEDPDDRDPLKLNAALVSSDPRAGDSVIAVLKLRILPTWYIYEKVPASQPFIETTWILDTGSALEAKYDWAGPPSSAHKSLADTTVHASSAKDLVFYHEMEVASADATSAEVTIGIRYQICNPEYCLPPKTKTRTLNLVLAGK